jgi:hypothetical protein
LPPPPAIEVGEPPAAAFKSEEFRSEVFKSEEPGFREV